MHNLHHDRSEDRYSEEDEKVRQLSHSLARKKKKKTHNLKANSGCQRWLEHLDLHNARLFFRISGYDARSPECSRETRFDMIILQLGSPLCHMPDLSVGRGMQLALLTINQPDGGGRWRVVVVAVVVLGWGGTSCSRMLANISLHAHTQLLHV